VISILDEHLGPRMVGESCLAAERLRDMRQQKTSPPVGGLGGYAITAIDPAL
jgi:hypothetical protein